MNKYAQFSSIVGLAALSLACSIGSVVQQAAPVATSVAQSAPTSAPLVAQPTPRAPTNVPSSSGNPAGKNLIVNGDAEAGPGAPDDATTVPVPGWTATGKFTAVQYGASGGFADLNSPGPKDRGKNYFVGGPDSEQSSAKQTINVAASAAQIDTGNMTYQFQGWLGGFEGQDDNATVAAEFLDGSGKSLGKATLGPVMAADRNSEAGSILKSVEGSVPKGTRTITIIMLFRRTDGSYNDASVDNLSLVLTTK